MGARRPNTGFPAQRGIKDQAGRQVPRSGKNERRKRLDADRDGKIGRTPNQIDGGEGSDEKHRIPLGRVLRERRKGCCACGSIVDGRERSAKPIETKVEGD